MIPARANIREPIRRNAPESGSSDARNVSPHAAHLSRFGPVNSPHIGHLVISSISPILCWCEASGKRICLPWHNDFGLRCREFRNGRGRVVTFKAADVVIPLQESFTKRRNLCILMRCKLPEARQLFGKAMSHLPCPARQRLVLIWPCAQRESDQNVQDFYCGCLIGPVEHFQQERQCREGRR